MFSKYLTCRSVSKDGVCLYASVDWAARGCPYLRLEEEEETVGCVIRSEAGLDAGRR